MSSFHTPNIDLFLSTFCCRFALLKKDIDADPQLLPGVTDPITLLITELEALAFTGIPEILNGIGYVHT